MEVLQGLLCKASLSKGKLDVVTLLFGMGAAIKAEGGECGNALHAAVSSGAIEVVKLMERGADVNGAPGLFDNFLQVTSSQRFAPRKRGLGESTFECGHLRQCSR